MNSLSKIFNNKTIHYLVLIAVIAYLLFFYCYGYIKYDYAVAPGDDNIRHMSEAKYISDHGAPIAHEGSFDPPLFHLLLSSLSLVSGLSIAVTTKIFAPLLAILATLSIYYLTRRLLGSKRLALIALLLLVFLSPQPYQIYNDGTYLNIFAATYLLIFTLAFVPPLLKDGGVSLKIILPFLIFSAALLLSHSLSATYFILIMAVYCLILLLKYRRRFFHKKNLLIPLVILIIVVLPFTWKFYLKDSIQKALSSLGLIEINTNNILSADFTTINPVPSFGTYEWLLNYLPIIFSLFGLIFLLKIFKNKINEKWLAVSWVVAMFIGSRTSFFQLPERFARDMAFVVIILSGVFIYSIAFQSNKLYRLVIISTIVILLSLNLPSQITTATNYDPMVRVQASDKKAMQWLVDNTQPNDIIMGAPRTIVAGDWGSYINLLTDRTTIDGTLCADNDDDVCDQLYNPNSKISLQYYQQNSIDYVYAGHIILGGFINKENIDWSYTKKLAQAAFLTKVAEFKENNDLGAVTIYRVDHDKLNNLLST